MFSRCVVSVVVRTAGTVVVFLASPVFAEARAEEALESSMPAPEEDAGPVASATNEEELEPAVGGSTPLEFEVGKPAWQPGQVEPQARAPLQEQEHGVFFLRVLAGAGTIEQSGVDDGIQVDAGGLAAWYTISIGASVLPNLALFGEVAGNSVFSANLFVDGRKNPKSVEYRGEMVELALPETIDYTGLGVGLAYYIMPVNIYLSASVDSVAGVVHREDLVDVFYGPGYVGRFAIGKEWWTMQSFGLGLAATATVGKLEELRLSGFGLALSATYN